MVTFNSTTLHTLAAEQLVKLPLLGAVIMFGASYYSMSSLHELTHLQCHHNAVRLAVLKFSF